MFPRHVGIWRNEATDRGAKKALDKEPTDDFLPFSDLKCSCNGELQMQKVKSHLLRTKSLKLLHLKPGVGQYKAIHAMLTAMDFFLAYFYTLLVHSPAFFPNLSHFFPV